MLALIGLAAIFLVMVVGKIIVDQRESEKDMEHKTASAQAEASASAIAQREDEENRQFLEKARLNAQPVGEPKRTQPLAEYSSGAEGATGKDETVYLKRPEGLESLAWVEFTFTPTTESNKGWEQIKVATITNDKINDDNPYVSGKWFSLTWDKSQQTYTASVWVGAIQSDEQDAFGIDLPPGTPWSVSVYSPDAAPSASGTVTNPASPTATNVTAFRFEPSAGVNFNLYSQVVENNKGYQKYPLLTRAYTYPEYSKEQLEKRRDSIIESDSEPHNGKIAARQVITGNETPLKLREPAIMRLLPNAGVVPVTVYSEGTQWFLDPVQRENPQ